MNTIDRREFLAGTAALAGGTLLPFSKDSRAEPPPETTRIRISKYPVTCIAPLYVSEALLRAEGFTQIDYIVADYGPGETSVGEGPSRADFDMDIIISVLTYIDTKQPVVTLSGVHLGCYELFGSKRVRSISELKGKRVPIDQISGSKHLLLSSMAAYVGINPKSINWVVVPLEEGRRLYEAGEVDAYFGFPPEPQELRAKKLGDVIVNTATDKPWSQYFCYMLVTHSAFARKYPIATKRVLRAMLKAADMCAANSESVAKMLMEKKLAGKYEYALETLCEVKFGVWRTYDPENSMRFHANRLYEVGMIKTPPNKLIAQGTDWRFLNELKRELKA